MDMDRYTNMVKILLCCMGEGKRKPLIGWIGGFKRLKV
jgi:hypothetical protein